MKYRREMTAEQHLIVLEDKGEIKVKGNKIIVFTDDDGEVSQVVSDYMAHFSRKGYEISYR
jgi:hypothetical protein